MDVVFDVNGLQVLQFIIAVLLPLLVGLVTKRVTSSGTKAVLLLALSAVSAVLTSWAAAAQEGTVFDMGAALLAALATFVVGVAVQFGFWRPVGATAAVQAVGDSSGTHSAP
jgi:hypothetical protein